MLYSCSTVVDLVSYVQHHFISSYVASYYTSYTVTSKITDALKPALLLLFPWPITYVINFDF